MNRRRRVRVPASSANLGPGYDVLAAALSLGFELEVSETGGDLTVECDVPGVALDRSNLCVRAFEALHPSEGLSFQIRSEIPSGAGLGSSAAAIVAGLTAADHMFELDAPIFDLALELEGHPDNVAAAIHGGFVICAGAGKPVRLDPPEGLEGLLATPPGAVPTTDARAALPAETPLAHAVYNVAHASLLVLGLARGDLGLIRRGLSDRLHQERRAHLYPRSMELVGRALSLGALGATISGAGPTVLFWCHRGGADALMEALLAAAPDCLVQRVRFVAEGAGVEVPA
ncbi:MAG: homoserine kinase [Thermoleophilaceae bacterium]